MTKVSNEVAKKDLGRWLDARRIGEKKREANAQAEEALLDAIECGDLIVNEDNSLTLKLIWGTNDGEGVKELTFKHRLTVGEKQAATKGISANDGEGRLIGLIAALTDQPLGVIKKLECGDDLDRAASIAVYFL